MLNLVAHKRPEGHFITNQPRTKTIWETRHGKQKKRFNVCLENKIITREVLSVNARQKKRKKQMEEAFWNVDYITYAY